MTAKIVVSQFITLDGVIEDPAGMENTGLGNWTGDFSFGARGDAFKERELFEADALLLGRRTYDAFAAVWPTVDSPYAEHINAMPKYLATRTLDAPGWNNTTALKGDLASAAADLKQRTDGTIVVFGSASVCHTLLAAGLVDELNLILYPVVLGKGLKLFPAGTATRFELDENVGLDDGLVLLRYRLKA